MESPQRKLLAFQIGLSVIFLFDFSVLSAAKSMSLEISGIAGISLLSLVLVYIGAMAESLGMYKVLRWISARRNR